MGDIVRVRATRRRLTPFVCLDLFCGHLEIERGCDRDDGGDQRGVVRIRPESVDEDTVDLDPSTLTPSTGNSFR